MAFKSNIDTNPRAFVVAPGGDDRFSGQTEETAKATIQAAVDEVNAVSPPPSPGDPVAIITNGSGIFRENIILPDACQFNGENISNNPLTGNAFEVASNAPFNITSSVIFGDNATAFVIPNKINVGVVASAVACIGNNCRGAHLTGSSDNIFLTFSQVRLQGSDGVGILDESMNGAPEIYNINELTISGDGCCGVRYIPQVGSSTATFNFGSILELGSPVNSIALDIQEGRLSAFGNTIVSSNAISVGDGATLDIVANNIVGDIIVSSGGTLNCYIQRFTGNITNNGTINGIIADDRFGNGNSDSTTLKSGGEISQGALNTQIDITAGVGTIYDYSDPANVMVFPVEFGPFTDVDITDVATELFSWITIDRAGEVIQFAPGNLSFETRRDYLVLGTVTHPAGIFQTENSNYITARETHSQFLDLLDALGVIRADGLVVDPNADLTFDKTSGILMNPGAGNIAGNRAENAVEIQAESPTVFSRTLGITGTSVAAGQTDVDPSNYDDGSGSAVAIPAANKATIQYVFQFPVDGAVFVQYGQTVYDNLEDAVALAASDNPIIPDFVRRDALLVTRIALEDGATDLTDELQAVFLPGSKFGVDITGGAGGTGAGGGDVFGPASSLENEIPTYDDETGKVIKASSDISALAGDIQRITADGDLTFLRNGTGKVHFGNGSILGDFGASETLGATTFSIASPLGFSATTNYEHNGALAATAGYHFVEDAIALRDTPTSKGIYIETDGQISLSDQIIEPNFSVIVGSFTDPFGLPQLNNAAEASVTGQPRMIHYNSILESIRYWNQNESAFESLVSGPDGPTADIIPTFHGSVGSRISSNSDVTINAGVMQRATTNQGFRINRNGTGPVQLGAGGVLGNFGAAETTGSCTFSIATNDPVGSSLLSFEQNSTVKGLIGHANAENLFGMTTVDGGGVFIEGGRTFIGIAPLSMIPLGVALQVGSTGINSMMIPILTSIAEFALTGVEGMFHYNTTSNVPKYFDGTSFRSVATQGATLTVAANTTKTAGISLNSWNQVQFGGSSAILSSKNFIKNGNNELEFIGEVFDGVAAIQFDWFMDLGFSGDTYDYEVSVFKNGAIIPNALYKNPDVDKLEGFMHGGLIAPLSLIEGDVIDVRKRQRSAGFRDVTFVNISVAITQTL